MTRVKVDFNNLVRGGQVRVSLRRVEAELTLGEMVEVFDPDAELECLAVVADIDRDAGRLYLSPLWGKDEKRSSEVHMAEAGHTFVWDGHRVTPASPLWANKAGGTTLAKTPKATPVLIETEPLVAAV